MTEKFEPTPAQIYSVELMSSIGIPQKDIAAALGVDEKTLRKHFRDQLDVGKTRVVTRVAESLVRQALAGNITAAIFFLKTQGRWKEPVAEEQPGKKAGRQAAAEKAAGAGRFAVPKSPKLVVDNS